MRRIAVAALIGIIIFVTGCNGLSDATKAQNVITAVITVAKAEVDIVPPQDQGRYTNFVNLAITLDGQLATCITTVKGMLGMGTNSKFAACFTVFASGLLSPAELAEFQLFSPDVQKKVRLYVFSIIAGVNVALQFFGNSAVPVPAVLGTPPSSSEIRGFMSPILAQRGLTWTLTLLPS